MRPAGPVPPVGTCRPVRLCVPGMTADMSGGKADARRAGLTRLRAVLDTVLPALDDAYATRYSTHVRERAVPAAEGENLREK